jgi:hypothetical protein
MTSKEIKEANKRFIEAKKKGYCSPYMRKQYAELGFDISNLKLTEEVKGIEKKPKKDKGRADYLIDRALGRC